MTLPPSEDWVEERRRLARAAPVGLLVFIAAGIGTVSNGSGASVIAGAVLGAAAGTATLLIVYSVARRQWAKPKRTGRIQDWYDLIVGLLLAPALLALAVVLLAIGDLLGRLVGVLSLAVAIQIARPRLAELLRRRGPTAGPH